MLENGAWCDFHRGVEEFRPYLTLCTRMQASCFSTIGSNMPSNYVLIDFENVQPKNLSILAAHPFKVLVSSSAPVRTKCRGTWLSPCRRSATGQSTLRLMAVDRTHWTFTSPITLANWRRPIRAALSHHQQGPGIRSADPPPEGLRRSGSAGERSCGDSEFAHSQKSQERRHDRCDRQKPRWSWAIQAEKESKRCRTRSTAWFRIIWTVRSWTLLSANCRKENSSR